MKVENRVEFRSRDAARLAGYRACKVCKPDGPESAPETFFLGRYHSPLGVYLLASSERGVVCVKTEEQAAVWTAKWKRAGTVLQDGGGHNRKLAGQLAEYFAGKRRRFEVPLDLRGTAFQLRVWKALCEIPYGETRSYGQIARALGLPRAARAVGRANATNPVAIVVPCHRVIGSNKALTGYGGGLHRKKALLELEARINPSLP
jgi:methylated-DNA-[protein]-cysteine S-methyltransferase